jgi:hypothetical protein
MSLPIRQHPQKNQAKGAIRSQKHLVSEMDIERIREEFPDDPLEIGIQKWAREHGMKDLFFYDSNGERCKWGECKQRP